MFLELPSEIRNHIYYTALVIQEPVELCPAVGVNSARDMSSLFRRFPAFASLATPKLMDDLERRQDSLKHDETFRLQKDLLHIRKTLAVGLLRTCRQIYDEAMGIFYAENSWQFSYDRSWHLLYRFLMTIGARARSYIQNLTIWAPFAADPMEGHGMFLPMFPVKNHPKMQMVKRLRCKVRGQKCRCWRSVFYIFMCEKTLKNIKFVVPSAYCVYDIDGRRTVPHGFMPKITLDIQPGGLVDESLNVEDFTSRGVSLSLLPSDPFGRTFTFHIVVVAWNYFLTIFLEKVGRHCRTRQT